MSSEIFYQSIAQLAAALKTDLARMGKVIKEAGIESD